MTMVITASSRYRNSVIFSKTNRPSKCIFFAASKELDTTRMEKSQLHRTSRKGLVDICLHFVAQYTSSDALCLVTFAKDRHCDKNWQISTSSCLINCRLRRVILAYDFAIFDEVNVKEFFNRIGVPLVDGQCL